MLLNAFKARQLLKNAYEISCIRGNESATAPLIVSLFTNSVCLVRQHYDLETLPERVGVLYGNAAVKELLMGNSFICTSIVQKEVDKGLSSVLPSCPQLLSRWFGAFAYSSMCLLALLPKTAMPSLRI